jgi:alpha-methylacyl-CoA racemase
VNHGPLAGLRVLELNGVGPTPFAGMMLADMGAEVLRVDRMTNAQEILGPPEFDLLSRGRRSIALDLKNERAREIVLKLVESHDVLLEGFRPGVCERLGIGPEDCESINPRLIFARMTGWGQHGPLSPEAGHDINYLAIGGGLSAIGSRDRPPLPPLNFVADFGGGGMLVVVGILAALHERRASGRGQVIDAAMIDGVTIQSAQLHGLIQGGSWTETRESNTLDGGAPFYRAYETLDDKYIAVSALEPHFYSIFLENLGLSADDWPQHDRSLWPQLYEKLTVLFATKTRDEWVSRFRGSDSCVTPVLTPTESITHKHLESRESFVTVDGITHPAPAPRFSRTATSIRTGPPKAGQHTAEVLAQLGFDFEIVRDLVSAGVVKARDFTNEGQL